MRMLLALLVTVSLAASPAGAQSAGVTRFAPRSLLRVEPLRIVVHRGDVDEATHLVHAVAVRDGAVVQVLPSIAGG